MSTASVLKRGPSVRSLFKRPSPSFAVPTSSHTRVGGNDSAPVLGGGSVEKIGSKASESSCGSGGAHNSGHSSSQNLGSINGGINGSNGGVSGSPSLSSSARRCSPRKLVTKRRWSDLLAVLNLPRRRQYVVTWEDSFSGHLFLHEVVSYDPPAEVVSRLIELYPPALCHRSISGCLPLHCAVMYGASPEVVRVLVEATDDEETVAEALSGAEDYGTDSLDFSAPSVGDSEGRTPLHLAVRKAVKAHRDPGECRRERNRMNGANKLKRGRSGGSTETADEEEEKRRALAVMEVVSAVTPLDVFYRRRDFGPKRETPVQAAESCEAVSAALLKAIQKRTAEDKEHQKSRSSINTAVPSSSTKLNTTNKDCKHSKAAQYKEESRKDHLAEDDDSVATAEDTEDDEKESDAKAKAERIRELMIWSRRQSTRNLKTSRSRMPPTLQPPAA